MTQPLPFYRVWWIAITRPLPDAYRDLMLRAGTPLRTAYLWMIVVSVLAGVVRLLVLLNTFFRADLPNVPIILISIPLAGVAIGILWFTFVGGLVHLSAKLLRGHGEFSDVIYLKAAHSAPFLLLIILLSLMLRELPDVLQWVLIALNVVYLVLLNYPTVKAAHGLDTGRTMIAAWLIPALVLGGVYYASTIDTLPDLFPGL